MPPSKIADAVTLQGVKQISDVTSGAFRRFFWFLVVCGGLSFTGFNIAKQIIHYRSSPVSVNIDVKLADKMSFPTVTICNNNFIFKSLLDEYNMTKLMMGLYPYDFQTTDTQGSSGVNFSAIDSWDVDFILKAGAHGVNDYLLECYWDGDYCKSTMFTQVSTDLGNCFAFNAHGSLQATFSGRQSGLSILLDARVKEFVKSGDSTEGVGFRIAIHSTEEPPIMGDIGVTLSPGSKHFLGLSAEVVTAPNGLHNCGTSKLRYSQKEYSREACRIECLTDFVVDLCNCRDMYMPGNARACLPSQAAKCLKTLGDEYAQYKGKCNAQCPSACNFTSYDVTIQSSLRLSDEYISTLAYETRSTYEYWKENFVSLDVYFTSMSYTYLEKRYSYSVLDLFCDIGGALGLFLGASLATAIELLDFSVRNILADKAIIRNSPKTVHVKPKT